jgi:hypothetical protein
MTVRSTERWWHPAKDFPRCPTCRGDFPGLRPTAETWQEVPIGDGWLAALRLAVQDGHPVVAELRVFPDEPGRHDAGRWSVERLGIAEAVQFVPVGGLTTRKLRHVKIAAALTSALPGLAGFIASMRRAFVGEHVGDLPLVLPGMESAVGAGIKRNRAATFPDRQLAEVAALYERLAKDPATSRAVSRALADALDEKVPRARQLTHAARARGLLTGGGKGRAGGVLTDKARALLEPPAPTPERRGTSKAQRQATAKGSRP